MVCGSAGESVMWLSVYACVCACVVANINVRNVLQQNNEILVMSPQT